jgi:thioredoxin reductase
MDAKETITMDDKQYVETDKFCRTTVKRVFAAGSCSTSVMLGASQRVVVIDHVSS